MNAKVRKSANRLLRLGIMLFTLVFLYRQLLSKTGIEQWIGMIETLIAPGNPRNMFMAALMLLALNLWLETVKWQFIMHPLEKVSFGNALAAVLSGISVSLFLPNRVGDYLGRIFVLRQAKPAEAVLLTIIGSFSHLLIIALGGVLALLALIPRISILSFLPLPLAYLSVLSGLVIIMGLLFLVYFNLPVLRRIFTRRTGRMQRIEQLLGVYDLLSNRLLWQVLGLSAARYLVYCTQFFLLIRAFGLEVPYHTGLALIGLTYLLMTLIPTIAISELGIRGSVVVAVFSFYPGYDSTTAGMAVLAASSLLWLINLAFPALMGAIAVNRLKFIRNDD
ncbi:MAG: flippase-like domain-containing protein [Bacteroidetes bacterium]|nr:flippase-like domain-containing protein [Bacteroidota bacterium]